MEPVGNIKLPLQEFFQQKAGLHTYRNRTLMYSIVSVLFQVLSFLAHSYDWTFGTTVCNEIRPSGNYDSFWQAPNTSTNH